MKHKNTMVTLVHGTWAQNAEWTQEGAPLYTALIEQGYKVDRLPWASWNRFSTRRDAAEKLRKHLEKNNDYDHFIIAHSHGGNVAVRALDGDDNLVKGLVCLNTPFFNILGRTPKMFEISLIFIATALSMIPVGLWLGYDYGWSAFFIYLGIMIAIAPIAYFFKFIYKFIQDKGKRFHFKALEKTPLYCLNTPDDEAFGVLAFFASTLNVLFLLISRVATQNQFFGGIIGALILFEVLPILYVPWDWFTNSGMYTREFIIAHEYVLRENDFLAKLFFPIKLFLIYISSCLYYLGAYYVLILVLLMTGSIIVTISQGFIAPLSGLFNRYIVSLTPLKSINTEFSEKIGDNVTLMRHSSLYNDKATINSILDWMGKHRQANNEGHYPLGK